MIWRFPTTIIISSSDPTGSYKISNRNYEKLASTEVNLLMDGDERKERGYPEPAIMWLKLHQFPIQKTRSNTGIIRQITRERVRSFIGEFTT